MDAVIPLYCVSIIGGDKRQENHVLHIPDTEGSWKVANLGLFPYRKRRGGRRGSIGGANAKKDSRGSKEKLQDKLKVRETSVMEKLRSTAGGKALI